MISTFWDSLRIHLCLTMWSNLENSTCALEKITYSASLEWNDLKISNKFILSLVSFKTTVFLLIFCLENLPIDINGVLKSSTLTASQLISHFMSIKICITYVGCINAYKDYILLLDCIICHCVVSFFVSYYSLGYKVYFVNIKSILSI